jgi:hypothetical protein
MKTPAGAARAIAGLAALRGAGDGSNACTTGASLTSG